MVGVSVFCFEIHCRSQSHVLSNPKSPAILQPAFTIFPEEERTDNPIIVFRILNLLDLHLNKEQQ